MKEIKEILHAIQETQDGRQEAVLATVVDIEGSAYRRPGARMLTTKAGWLAGGVSGGCLESDLVERAWKLTEQGHAVVLTYDTRADTDVIFGMGMGCRGVVRVLIERIAPDEAPHWIAFLQNCIRHRARGVMATVVRVEGTIGARVGSRLCLEQAGAVTSDIRDGALAARVHEDACRVMECQRSETMRVTLAEGAADVFFECVVPAVPLVVFGAGHDAIPVVRIAKEIGWHVTVVDGRPAYASPQRFPSADAVVLSTPEGIREHVRLDGDTVALVMTHNYAHDVALLTALLPSSVRYLGVLGPRHRTDRLLLDVMRTGITWSDAQASRLYGPVGLDIGADTSEGIAMATLAEIQAVLAGRPGGSLRQRQGPIHAKSDPERIARWETSWTATPSTCGRSAL